MSIFTVKVCISWFWDKIMRSLKIFVDSRKSSFSSKLYCRVLCKSWEMASYCQFLLFVSSFLYRIVPNFFSVQSVIEWTWKNLWGNEFLLWLSAYWKQNSCIVCKAPCWLVLVMYPTLFYASYTIGIILLLPLGMYLL